MLNSYPIAGFYAFADQTPSPARPIIPASTDLTPRFGPKQHYGLRAYHDNFPAMVAS